MRFICQSDERLLIVGNCTILMSVSRFGSCFEGTALKPSFWNTPLEAPLMPPQAARPMPAPHSRGCVHRISRRDEVKALAYAKRMASNGGRCRTWALRIFSE